MFPPHLRSWCCGTCIFQEGSSEWDVLRRAAAPSGGGVVLTGHSQGKWSGTNIGIGGFAAMELDLNGAVLWRWQVNLERLFTVSSEYSVRRVHILQTICHAKRLC